MNKRIENDFFICPGGGHFFFISCSGVGSKRSGFCFSTPHFHTFGGVDDHITPDCIWVPTGLQLASDFVMTVSPACVWLGRMVVFGIGDHIVPLRASL